MTTKRAVHIYVRFRYPDEENGVMNGDETEMSYLIDIEHLAFKFLTNYVFGEWQFAIKGTWDAPTSLMMRLHIHTLKTGQAATSTNVVNIINNWAHLFTEHVEVNGAFSFYLGANDRGYSNVEKIGAFPVVSSIATTVDRNWLPSGDYDTSFVFGNNTGEMSANVPPPTDYANHSIRYLSSWIRRSVAVLPSDDFAHFVEAWKKCILLSAKEKGLIGKLNADALWWNDHIQFEKTA